MHPLCVVEQLDVKEQRAQRVRLGFWQAASEVVEALGLDCGPEGLGQGIIV